MTGQQSPVAQQRTGVRIGCGPLLLLGVVGAVVAFVLDLPWWLEAAAVLVAVVGLKIGRTPPDPAGETDWSAERLGRAIDSKSEELDQTRSVVTLSSLVKSQREMIAVLPADHPDRPRRLQELANSLQSGIVATGKEKAGNRPLVVEAVRASRESVERTPADHPERLTRLHTHQLNLSLYKAQGITPPLDEEAIDVGREAIALGMTGDPARPDQLSYLAISLLDRAGRDVDAIEECVQLFRDAIDAARAAERGAGPYLARLIAALGLLAEVRGDRAPLDEAVAITRTDAYLDVSGRQRGYSLSTLSLALFQLAARRDDAQVFAQAVEVTRTALALLPRRDRAARVELTRNLCAGLTALASMIDDPELLHESVRTSRRALIANLRNKSHRHACLVGWGKALYVRHRHLRSPRDLRKAQRRIFLALLMTPANRINRVEDLSLQAAIHRTKFEQGGDGHHLDLAYKAAVIAAKVAAALGPSRFEATVAAELAVLNGHAEEALRFAEQAVAELPEVGSRRAGWMDRHHHFAGLGGLAATAAVAAVAAGRPERAVELLEQTRGILLADTFDIRADSSRLAAVAPELAAEYDRLAAEIDAADHATGAAALGLTLPSATAGYELLAARRAGLDEQWRDLLGRIRTRSGLRNFLVPPTIEQLRRVAGAGPIVYVVPSELGGQALIVVDDASCPVQVVRLRAFTTEYATALAAQLAAAVRAAGDGTRRSTQRAAAQSEIAGILGRLWQLVAEPVLTRLGHTGPPPDGSWPHLWWCPVGVATQLPLHAAGRHVDGESVLDRVVSSYTPTIRALSHARANRNSGSGTVASTLVVAVQDAPGGRQLDGVVDEAAAIRRLIPEAAVLPAPGATTTYDAVLAALATHQIAHFACHAVADLSDPSASRLLLHDHQDKPLTLPVISGLRLDHGELVYLSACSTTGTSENQADEAAHLAAAFQLAGYRAVIGTLWPVNDKAAVTMAEEFYGHLTQGGRPDPAAAALALHHSVRFQRDRYPGLPTRWAAQIHMGR